jgi:hypothetical protein
MIRTTETRRIDKWIDLVMCLKHTLSLRTWFGDCVVVVYPFWSTTMCNLPSSTFEQWFNGFHPNEPSSGFYFKLHSWAPGSASFAFPY